MKHLVLLIGYATAGLLAALFLMGFERVVPVHCGPNDLPLDDVVNADDPSKGTRFQLDGGCTYTVDSVLALKNGDEIAGPEGSFIPRAPAFDPEPTATIVGSEGLSNVIRPEGTVHLEWVKIVGGTGQYSGGTPVAGTGSGLAMGMASNASSLYAVHITGSDAAGITNAHGTFDRIELDHTTQDSNFLGFTGSALKAVTEVEVKNSYVHDNQGNGIWCDSGCDDATGAPFTVYHVDSNLVVNNGRAGIRYEHVGDSASASPGEALIENNHVHGNGTNTVRGGIDIRDAQNALVQNNQFGADTHVDPDTHVEFSYPRNANSLAIRATDSGRSDRSDLFNIDILGNVLNGETIVGCEQPDEIVACFDAPPPPSPPDDTSAPTVISTVPGPGATGVSPSINNLKATFSEAMDASTTDGDPSTITATTFMLFSNGSTTQVAARVSYDSSTRTAKLNPNNNLRRGVTYRAVLTTGVQDVAGNSLAQQIEWLFTVKR